MQFFSCSSDLMKYTCWLDESLSSTTNVLFQRRIYLLLNDTIEWEIYTNWHTTDRIHQKSWLFMDKWMKNRHHINIITSHSFSILGNIRSIRPYLDIETTKTIIQALTFSRMDYCNSLLEGSANVQLAKLQRIQNMGCRTIYSLRKYDHIPEHMWDLHWLWITR